MIVGAGRDHLHEPDLAKEIAYRLLKKIQDNGWAAHMHQESALIMEWCSDLIVDHPNVLEDRKSVV